MFSLFHIGVLEVVSLLNVVLVLGVLGFVRPTAWRWLGVFSCILIISMICTPADPLSMWLFAAPTCAVFAAGVFVSPYLSGPAKM
jgi:Sec-independent protein secretion pathway component TatC